MGVLCVYLVTHDIVWTGAIMGPETWRRGEGGGCRSQGAQCIPWGTNWRAAAGWQHPLVVTSPRVCHTLLYSGRGCWGCLSERQTHRQTERQLFHLPCITTTNDATHPHTPLSPSPASRDHVCPQWSGPGIQDSQQHLLESHISWQHRRQHQRVGGHKTAPPQHSRCANKGWVLRRG